MRKYTKMNIMIAMAGVLLIFGIVFFVGRNIDMRRQLREYERNFSELKEQCRIQHSIDSLAIEAMMQEISSGQINNPS